MVERESNTFFERINYCFFVLRMNVERWGRIIKARASLALSKLYNFLRIEEGINFFYFLFHRYRIKQFNVLHVSENMRLLFRMKPQDGVTSTRDGKLRILSSKGEKFLFSLKNILFFNTLQKRVERVIFYTYVTLTLELNNPFDRKTLMFFLQKKIALLERLLGYVKTVNGKEWDQSEIRLHTKVFERNSLFQAEVIRTMQLAVKRQKEPAVIKEGKEALKKGLQPVLIVQGLSGAYWIRGVDRRVIGLFKPFDEEIHAPNNPVGPKYRGALGLRKTRYGCRVGESAHHEVAAFVVDEFFGFGIVPRTYYAQFEHRSFYLAREDRLAHRRSVKTKLGSFQEFVEGFVSINKLSKEEIASIPLDEFQLLALLDVIVGNTDRNIGNILFGAEKIAAIDHGLCFPDTIDDFSFWYWHYFAQGEKPLFQPIVELLNSFPYDRLEERLKAKCFISNRSLQRMRERVALFAAAINLGLTLSQMADLFKPQYLYPLHDLKETLKGAAETQVQLYKESLDQPL